MATVVHIGFPKTGTTTLQRHFFPTIEGWAYAGRRTSHGALLEQLVESLLFADDADFLAATMRGFLDDLRAGHDGVIVSRETITKYPAGGRTAQRLQTVVPDARIVICIRDQRAMLRSLYAQHLRGGGSTRFPEWVGGVLEQNLLAYDVLVECYQGLFGRDTVKVLPFELLVADERRFLGDLLAFIAPGRTLRSDLAPMPVTNRSVVGPARRALRPVNQVLKRSDFVRRHIGKTRRLRKLLFDADRALFSNRSRELSPADTELIDRVLPNFEDGNARLEILTGLELAAYGYPLARRTARDSVGAS